jgi:hypothetical protein
MMVTEVETRGGLMHGASVVGQYIFTDLVGSSLAYSEAGGHGEPLVSAAAHVLRRMDLFGRESLETHCN